MNLHAWLNTIQSIAPLVLARTPLAPIAPYVSIGIQAAEQIPGASGPDKLAIAKQIVHIGITATNAQVGAPKIDPAIADQVITDGINTVIGATNLAHSFQEPHNG